MEKVKVHLTNGTVQTIEGEIEKITYKDIPIDKDAEIKLVDVNDDIESYETYNEGGPLLRPRRPR
tara:strand:+ start:893 stop:1087 length:195 start_codon:yes stop_codon:yes gene_type:complete